MIRQVLHPSTIDPSGLTDIEDGTEKQPGGQEGYDPPIGEELRSRFGKV
jgi:hypothetical protein